MVERPFAAAAAAGGGTTIGSIVGVVWGRRHTLHHPQSLHQQEKDLKHGSA
jgi:hypothetical protein